MIQRIQTLFLFLAACAGAGQFALPYTTTGAEDAAKGLPALSDTVFNPFDNPGLTGLCILSGVVSLAAIFLYKNRPLQRRIAGAALLVSVLLLVLLGFTVWQMTQSMPQGGTMQYQPGIALPVAALLLQWLSGRFIQKDETLVRSMDRLR
jgi:peptidoglycan/LPS O-acetylase OafA/YrhL